MAQLVERELAADGVASDGYGALSLVGARGSLSLTQLADELGLPLTTASDVVRRLEGRRHVKRRRNPEDGRSWLFELSPAGDREWRRGWGALQRVNERLDARLRDFEGTRASLTELGSAFADALTDD